MNDNRTNPPAMELPIDVSADDYRRAQALMSAFTWNLAQVGMPCTPSALHAAMFATLALSSVHGHISREAFLERAAKMYDHAVAASRWFDQIKRGEGESTSPVS